MATNLLDLNYQFFFKKIILPPETWADLCILIGMFDFFKIILHPGAYFRLNNPSQLFQRLLAATLSTFPWQAKRTSLWSTSGQIQSQQTPYVKTDWAKCNRKQSSCKIQQRLNAGGETRSTSWTLLLWDTNTWHPVPNHFIPLMYNTQSRTIPSLTHSCSVDACVCLWESMTFKNFIKMTLASSTQPHTNSSTGTLHQRCVTSQLNTTQYKCLQTVMLSHNTITWHQNNAMSPLRLVT